MNEELVERSRLAVALGQEALGLLMAADGPMDAVEEPAFETPAEVAESWLLDRTDIKLFDARIDAAGRVVADSLEGLGAARCGRRSSRSTSRRRASSSRPARGGRWWRRPIPICDGGQRRAVRAGREADLLADPRRLGAKASCGPAPACAPPA